MIVYSAFVPHSPLLLPTIGKGQLNQLQKTLKAFEEITTDLYFEFPDVFVMIGAHRVRYENAFSVNIATEYSVDLKEFGDLSRSRSFYPCLPLADALQRYVRKHEFGFTQDSQPELDYGIGVPLLKLTSRSVKTPLLMPISYPENLSTKDLVTFGHYLHEVLTDSTFRIAVIASGDLSHALTSGSPAGYQPEGERFDAAMIQAIEQFSLSQLLSIPSETTSKAAQCGRHPLIVLFATLERMNLQAQLHSYEAPFGVGYAVASFSHTA